MTYEKASKNKKNGMAASVSGLYSRARARSARASDLKASISGLKVIQTL